MKKIFYVLMSSALVAASFTSCKNVEEDIWDESAVERLEQVKGDYAEVLKSAKNGWEMQYFPTSSTPGYVMAVKFNEDESVVAAANNRWTNNVYKISEKSAWSINIDNGPVLSFNSYNSIIHIFSDPNEIPGTSYGTGLGMEGDYEFIMIDVPEDGVIVLKGKKRGTYAYLKRIPENVDWEQFLGSINAKQQTLVADNPSPMLLTVGDKKYNMWYKKSSNLLNIVPVGGDTITQEKLYHYTFNSTGLYILEPFDLGGAENLQWFDTDQAEGEDWTAMKSMFAKKDIDGEKIEGATITAGDPLQFFSDQLNPSADGNTSVADWKLFLDEKNMSAENIAKFKAFDDALAATFQGREYRITADYETVGTALQVTLRRTGQSAAWLRIGLDKTAGDNSVILNVQNGENGGYNYAVSKGYDVFFKTFMSENASVVDNFLSIFKNAEFKFDFVSYLTLRTIKMNNVQNENSWFVIESSYIRR